MQKESTASKWSWFCIILPADVQVLVVMTHVKNRQFWPLLLMSRGFFFLRAENEITADMAWGRPGAAGSHSSDWPLTRLLIGQTFLPANYKTTCRRWWRPDQIPGGKWRDHGTVVWNECGCPQYSSRNLAEINICLVIHIWYTQKLYVLYISRLKPGEWDECEKVYQLDWYLLEELIFLALNYSIRLCDLSSLAPITTVTRLQLN